MTKFILSTIFQSFRNLLFDLILHLSEVSSSALMAEQAEIGNVWLDLKLKWILLWQLSQIWIEKRCQTNNWKYFMSSKFWLCATDSFFGLTSAQFQKLQYLLVEILSSWCWFNGVIQCKTPLLKLSISSRSKPRTRSCTRHLKCFVLEHSVSRTKHLRHLVWPDMRLWMTRNTRL